MLYLFQKADETKAFDSFKKAVKYSRPKSKYHASLSLLYLARIKCNLKQIEKAEKFTTEAIELTPDFAEALYQNAQYNALLNNIENSLDSLKRAVEIDAKYCLKTNSDHFFKKMRTDVDRLFMKLRDTEIEICKSKNSSYKRKIAEIKNIVSENNIMYDTKNTEQKFKNAENLIKRNSYFDSLKAKTVLNEIKKQIHYDIDFLLNELKERKNELDNEIKAISKEKRNERDSSIFKNQMVLVFSSFFLPFIVVSVFVLLRYGTGFYSALKVLLFGGGIGAISMAIFNNIFLDKIEKKGKMKPKGKRFDQIILDRNKINYSFASIKKYRKQF